MSKSCAIWIFAALLIPLLGSLPGNVSAGGPTVVDIKKDLSTLYLISMDGTAVLSISCMQGSTFAISLMAEGAYLASAVGPTMVATIDTTSLVAKSIFNILSSEIGYIPTDSTFIDVISDGVVSIRVGAYHQMFNSVDFKAAVKDMTMRCYF